jgi:hypothetical protein
MIDEAIAEIEPLTGTLSACRALGASRAGVYQPPAATEGAGTVPAPDPGAGAVGA